VPKLKFRPKWSHVSHNLCHSTKYLISYPGLSELFGKFHRALWRNLHWPILQLRPSFGHMFSCFRLSLANLSPSLYNSMALMPCPRSKCQFDLGNMLEAHREIRQLAEVAVCQHRIPLSSMQGNPKRCFNTEFLVEKIIEISTKQKCVKKYLIIYRHTIYWIYKLKHVWVKNNRFDNNIRVQ